MDTKRGKSGGKNWVIGTDKYIVDTMYKIDN